MPQRGSFCKLLEPLIGTLVGPHSGLTVQKGTGGAHAPKEMLTRSLGGVPRSPLWASLQRPGQRWAENR